MAAIDNLNNEPQAVQLRQKPDWYEDQGPEFIPYILLPDVDNAYYYIDSVDAASPAPIERVDIFIDLTQDTWTSGVIDYWVDHEASAPNQSFHLYRSGTAVNFTFSVDGTASVVTSFPLATTGFVDGDRWQFQLYAQSSGITLYKRPYGSGVWQLVGSKTGLTGTIYNPNNDLIFGDANGFNNPMGGKIYAAEVYMYTSYPTLYQAFLFTSDDLQETAVGEGFNIRKQSSLSGPTTVTNIPLIRNSADTYVVAPDEGTIPQGVPIDPSSDWRLTVEALRSTQPDTVWGSALWGDDDATPNIVTDYWGTWGWEQYPIDTLRGIETFRGADEPNGRPRVGEATLTFAANTYDGEYPRDPYYTVTDISPGQVVRMGLISLENDFQPQSYREYDYAPSGWIPIFTGLIDTVEVQYVVQGVTGIDGAPILADKITTMTLVEPLSVLANYASEAVDPPVGAGEGIADRAARLLEDAAWKFGLYVNDMGGDADATPNTMYTLQATNMASNRIDELYVSADSTGAVFRSDKTGAAVVERRYADWTAFGSWFFFNAYDTEEEFGSSNYATATVDVEPLVFRSSTDSIYNDHRYSIVGTAIGEQVIEHTSSIGRYGRFTKARTDLICEQDAMALSLAATDSYYEARNTYQVEGLTMQGTSVNRMLWMAFLDIGMGCSVFTPTDPGGYVEDALIRSVRHSITPMQGSVDWISAFEVDVLQVENVLGSPTLDP